MADEFTAADFAPSEADEFTAADFAPKASERITNSAVRDAEGAVFAGANHPEILARLGLPIPDRDERNTHQFGYGTNLRPFVTRDEAAPIAELSGQKLGVFDAGDTQPHSDQIAAFPGSSLPLSDLSTLQEPGGYAKQLEKVAQAEEAPEPLLKLPELPEAIRKYYALPPRLIAGERAGQITEGAVQALYDAAKSLPEFFTTEEGVLSALAGLTPLGRAGVTAYFTYDMAKSLLDQAGAAGAEWDNLNAAEKAQKITQAAVTLGFVGMLASAGIGQAKGAVKTAADLLRQPPETAPPTERPGGAPPTAPAEVKAEVGEVPKAAPTEPAVPTPIAPEPERQAPVVAEPPPAAPAEPAPPSLEEQAQASMKKSEEEYFRRQAEKGRKPKATLAQVIEQRGRQGVEELLDEWTQGAELSEDGKTIRAPLDPRESDKLTKVPARDFLLWLEDRPEAPTPKAPEPAAPEPAPTLYANRPRTTRSELPKPVLPELQSPEDFMANEIQKLAITKPEAVARYKPKGPAFDLSGWTDSAKREAEGIRDIFAYVPEGTDKFIVEFPAGTLPENAVSSLVEAIKQGDGPGTGWLPISQSDAIRDAFKGGRPVLAESADAHGIRPPVGYVKEGGIYRRMDRPAKGARTGAAQVSTGVAAPEPAAKEPWQMTKGEAFKLREKLEQEHDKLLGSSQESASVFAERNPIIQGVWPDAHYRVVVDALEEGKPVPTEVLADYPDLKPAAPAAEGTIEDIQRKLNSGEKLSPEELRRLEQFQSANKKQWNVLWVENGKNQSRLFTEGSTAQEFVSSLQSRKAGGSNIGGIQVKEAIPAAEAPKAPAAGEPQYRAPEYRVVRTPYGDFQVQTRTQRMAARPSKFTNVPGAHYDTRAEAVAVANRMKTESRGVPSPAVPSPLSEAIEDAHQTPKPPAPAASQTAAAKGETTPPPPPSMAGPGMVGMGAETAEDFLPAATTATSIKNAVVDQERARRGLSPAFEPIRRSFGEVWDRAMALIDRDPSYQDRLIAELKAKPRALTDTEDAALLHRQVDLQNEYGKATRDLAQSYADGRTEAVEADKARVAALSDALLDLYNVGKTSGTETGRGLNARKMMANEDFTLATMEMQSRAAKGGRPLTDAEREQLVVLERQIAATQKAYDDYVVTAEERQRKLEADLALARTKAEAASEPKYAPRVIQLAEKFATFMDSRANEALARLKARRAQPGATSGGLDPADLDDLAIVGAAKITRGAFELARWSDAMIRDVGEWVRPHLQAVWDAANKVFSLETSKLERQEGKAIAGAVKKKAAAPTPKDEIGKLGDQIRDKVEKKELDKINWYVRKLARVFYQQGITERDPMVDALHDVLKDILPDWTRRQTADAFSGYGDFKPLSKDAITVALRGMKGELQQLAKLEDMAAGQPPLKSGLERRTPTEIERQLIKRVNDAKYKFQIPVQDPSTQLKSALDTMKTSLRNRITDYEDRLARRDFTPRPRRKIELDPEATRLKAQAERTKDKFREALIADRLANRTKWEKALDWGTKYRRFGVLSSIRVIPKLLSAGLQRLASMPLEELAGSAWELVPAVRRVGEKAPLEGGGRNWQAETSGFARAFTQGMKDAYDVIRTGRSEMDVLYGKSTDNYIGEAEFGSKLLSFPGRVHGMIKVPVKRAAFERAVQRLADFYARQGLDVTDELVKTRIAVEAYKAGNRAIFLNNNFVADKINAFLALKVDPTTGKPTLGSKVWATGGRIVLPIIRVPVNIVAETMQYAGGLVSGNLRLANAFRKGIETLQPEQADLIMRELKKGSVGAAVLLLGYFNADKVGGYYQPGQKRDPRDVKAGNLRIFGVQIPSWLMHNPLLETLQVGATVRRVADSKLRKKDTQVQGLASGVWAAALGMTEQVPFVRGMADYEKLRNPYTRGEFGGEYVKGLVVPSAIQQAAQWTDPLDPRLQRKPTTLGQHIATGIPGLRQRVPTAPVKGQPASVPPRVLDAVTIRP